LIKIFFMNYTFSICPQCNSLNKVQTEKAREAVCGKCQAALPLRGLVSEVSADGFRRIIAKSEHPVIVDFWASWCGPCQMYGPEFEKASLENPEAVFLKINTETEQALSTQLGIRGIPCTLVYKNGKEVKRQPGAMNAQQVRSLLQS
jgi:thioredoxin 2